MCHGTGRLASHDALGIGQFIVKADKRLTVGIETVGPCICQGVISIVVTALLVLRFMVNDRRGSSLLYLHLTSAQVALEVLHVGGCVPQTPLGKRKEFHGLLRVSGVADGHLLHFGPCVQWHEEKLRDLYAVLASRYAGVVQPMAALITVEWGLARLPAGTPHNVSVLNIKVSAAVVHRYVIVAVARDAAEFGILIERVTSRRIGYEAEEILIAQVVNPGEWSCRVGDYIFTVFVVEMSVCLFHCSVL